MSRLMKLPEEEKQKWAVELIRKKCEELGRIPRKNDFDGVTLSRIKAYLGPWPRALEKSGLKEKNKPSKRNNTHHTEK